MMHQVFRGKTLAEAKRQAVTSLGEDAVVIATRKVARTGIAGMLGGHDIEVAATPGEDDADDSREAAALERAARIAKARMTRSPERPFSEGVYRAAEENEEAAAVPESKPAEEIQKLRAELKAELRAVRLAATRVTAPAPSVPAELMTEIATMRSMMDEMLAPALKAGGKLTHLLDARGIEGPVAHALLRRLNEEEVDIDEGTNLKERLRDAISDVIRVMPWPVAHEGRALVAMVGPAGVGKTTSAAKLAAHAIRAGKSVTLVGADSFRVGAAMQLQRYAELLGTHFELAASAGELARVLKRDQSDLVIVDTSGQAMPEPHAPEAFVQRSAEGEGLGGRARYVLLCVPAAIRAADARRVSSRYGVLAPNGLIVTKLDETDAPAGLLHASYATRLPTTALCFGPQVPDAIAPASHGAILDHLIPLASRKDSGR
ncbi:MAG: AAA family ATPase [Polyangiaceae bacterium]